jgi:uncharacterized repeat protein (TIGR01451 family)
MMIQPSAAACSRLALVALLAVSATVFAQQKSQTEKPFAIHYHERMPALVVDVQGSTPEQQQAPQARQAPKEKPRSKMAFGAFGKAFDLDLEDNEQLTKDLPQAQRERLAVKLRIYRGRLAGNPQSWVRITQAAGRMSGMIWDGKDVYLLDTSDEIADALPSASAKQTKPHNVIFRLKDVVWKDAQCALDPNAAPINDYRGLVQELQQQALALPVATREVSLAIVADTQFVQRNSLDPEAAVLARMNVVDGIFSEQVGVHLRVAEIRALSSNGTLSATNPGTLLTQFSNYSSSGAINNPGLAHLFTGRDMDGNVVGIAFLGSLCSTRAGTGVSQVTGTGTAGALIVAHEMGHNFGAPHDNQGGSACASTPGTFLMNPSINGSDQFSACSLSQIRPNVDAAACVTPVAGTPSADVRPRLPVNPINAGVNANFTYRVEVANGGTASASGVGASVSVPSGLQLQSATTSQGKCSNAATQVSCNIGTLPAGQTRTITLTLRSATAGRYTSNVSVTASNDSNTGNNQAAQSIVIASSTASSVLLDARFDAGADGFTYLDDVFRGTRQPSYATGSRVATGGFSGGGLRVAIGGINNDDILGMSGGWRRGFTLATPRSVRVSFRYRLNQAANYESDERSQVLVAIDGRLLSQVSGRDYVAQISGDGEGGAVRTTGWQQVTVPLGTLAAGSHTLTIGGYNSKKTFNDERTDVFIDEVVVTAQ